MTHPIWAGPMLDVAAAREYRVRAVFECGKLDPQVGDTGVLAPLPLVIAEQTWRELSELAEALAREALGAERELLGRPEVRRVLGLPRSIERVLARGRPADVDAGPRVCRLDFHWATSDSAGAGGAWRVSEVNADVPGGLIEAGPLARLFRGSAASLGSVPATAAIHVPNYALAPDPGIELARSLRRWLAKRSGDTGSRPTDRPLVALVHATAFADDFQVMRRLATCLGEAGVDATLVAPDHLGWTDGGAFDRRTGAAIDGVVRFFPAEWLPGLGRTDRWRGFFGGPRDLVVSNPATALLVQSKRWALAWDRLETPLDTWRRLMPETRDPRETRAPHGDSEWVLKPAMGRVGEGVLVPGLRSRDDRTIRRSALRSPRSWVAQRRFESIPVPTPMGPVHVCLGVYVVDGAAAGMYARAAAQPLIGSTALELPVLVASDAVPSRRQESLQPPAVLRKEADGATIALRTVEAA